MNEIFDPDGSVSFSHIALSLFVCVILIILIYNKEKK